LETRRNAEVVIRTAGETSDTSSPGETTVEGGLMRVAKLAAHEPLARGRVGGKSEGAGMGLAGCRRIAERHGVRIAARSSPGSGAGFIVTLPLKQPTHR
jgi:light-regulated signal transduction histidine kinase (bacteriophytochrome)